MTTSIRWMRLVLLACLGAACTEPGPPEVRTSLPRALSGDETAVLSAANDFTLALFKETSAAEPGRNVFLSPLSASFALGMTLNGARGGTYDAMRGALQFGDLPQAGINEGYHSLMELLSGLDPTTEIQMANAVWFRNTFPIHPQFDAAVTQYFSAEASALDFANPEAVSTINSWVNDRTAGRIPAIVEKIEPGDQMFLVNAIYFKGNWRYAFDRSATKPGWFFAADGSKQEVQMMRLHDQPVAGEYMEDGSSAVELPYGNAAFNMVVILPPEKSTLDEFVAGLTPEKWEALTSGLNTGRKWTVYMPRLRLEYTRQLKPELAALGMGVAFTEQANFAGMSSPEVPVLISTVLQKTFLSIDEEGTEAAAVTKVGAQATSGPPTISCDRPYLIVIRERLSGTVMFVGKVNTML